MGIWMSSILPAAVAWSACKKSKSFHMKCFQVLNVATGLLPVIIGMSYHFSDFYDVVSGSGDDMISKWMIICFSGCTDLRFVVYLLIHCPTNTINGVVSSKHFNRCLEAKKDQLKDRYVNVDFLFLVR